MLSSSHSSIACKETSLCGWVVMNVFLFEFFGGNTQLFFERSLEGVSPGFCAEVFQWRTLEVPARPFWAYVYIMSFIKECKGHDGG